MEYFGYIVLSLVILLVMVLIHELGHYTAAKILGFTVDEFSIGFGPKLFGKIRKNGERLSGIDGKTADKPAKDEDLLSYVMRAEIAENKAVEQAKQIEQKPIRLDKHGNPAKSFNQQKPWKRIIVLLGGVVFNLLSAVVFSLIYIGSVPVVGEVYKDPAGNNYCALEKGDIILAVDGKDIGVMASFSELTQGIAEEQTVTLKVERDGEIEFVDVKRQKIERVDDDGEKADYVGFGVTMPDAVFRGNDAGTAFKYCVPYTFKLSWSILGSFGGLITGRIPITSMSGPIGSIKMMADVSIANWRNILILLPLLASNLAMFNILPFPALDGARIVFTVIEWIRKKPMNRKVEGMINFIGLVVLMLFVVIVDILSFAL